jgi:hypothetical protein
VLTLNRSPGDSLIIQPQEDIPYDMTVRELFANGPIVITTTDNSVKIGVEAPSELLIICDEKYETSETGTYSISHSNILT